MPKNTPAGLIIAGVAFLSGFGLIWHIWWLAIVGLCGGIITLIIHSFAEDNEFVIAASEVARIEARAQQTV